jgi:hypothetical protein
MTIRQLKFILLYHLSHTKLLHQKKSIEYYYEQEFFKFENINN